MQNFRQAPKLYHSQEKEKKNTYMLPQKLMDSVFNQLDGKHGNQIKLMTVLLGTAGNGSFAVSEKWICDRTGMDQSNYNRARKALIEKGWLKLEDGHIYVDFDAIRMLPDNSTSTHVGDMSSGNRGCDDHMPETCADNMHNIEKQKNYNIKETDNVYDCAVVSQRDTENDKNADVPEYIQNKFNEMGIDFKPNTVTALEGIIGEKLNYIILDELLNRYRTEFAKARKKPQSYIFGILKKKVQEDYHKIKRRNEALRAEQDRACEERRRYASLNMDRIRSPYTTHNEEDGLGDISGLLDDLFSSEPEADREVEAGEEPESLRILARLKAESSRENEEELFWAT